VVLLLGYTALGHLPTMLALSLFVAVVVTLGRMYRDSEMAIWFASGLGLGRFVRPVLRMAWPVLVVVGALLLFVWPWGNQSSAELRSRYEQRSDLSRVAPGVFQASRDGSRVFFVDRASQEGVEGHNVFVLTRQPPLESVVSARSGQLLTEGADRVLQLDSGQRTESDSQSGVRTLSSFERYRVVVGESAARTASAARPRHCPRTRCCAIPRCATRPSWPGAWACCWPPPTCCCWAWAWPPPSHAAPATGTCCWRC
jgi:lipopolysaccharide export system permease protein